MAKFPIFVTYMRKETRQHELLTRMKATYMAYEDNDILKFIRVNEILARWSANVLGWDRRDPICELSVDIEDEEKAVLFKLWISNEAYPKNGIHDIEIKNTDETRFLILDEEYI